MTQSKPIFLCVLPSLVLLPCYSAVLLAYLMVCKQWRSTELNSPPQLAIYVYTREAFRRVLKEIRGSPVGWSWPALG